MNQCQKGMRLSSTTGETLPRLTRPAKADWVLDTVIRSNGVGVVLVAL